MEKERECVYSLVNSSNVCNSGGSARPKSEATKYGPKYVSLLAASGSAYQQEAELQADG